MSDLRRRQLLKTLLASPFMLTGACTTQPTQKSASVTSQTRFHVVVLGGGYAGATAARMLKSQAADVQVTLVEYNKAYATPPAANWVLGGIKSFPAILQTYAPLKKLGIRVVHDWVTAIDIAARNLRFGDGSRLGFDHLIVSPGIRYHWTQTPGLSEEQSKQVPHAWDSGVQTLILQQQLKDLPNGGVVAMSCPEGRYRCPQAFYERISLIGHYLKKHKPRSKLFVFDPQPRERLRVVFEPHWRAALGWGAASSPLEIVTGADARVTRIDVDKKTLFSQNEAFALAADVINFIPSQGAASIAYASGLTDASGWCPVRPLSGESTQIPGLYILGDAAAYGPFEKSASAARSEAQLAVLALLSALRQDQSEDAGPAEFVHRCESLVDEDSGVYFENRFQRGDHSYSLTGQTHAVESAKHIEHVWRTVNQNTWG